jgi:toxin ParE1/3/4
MTIVFVSPEAEEDLESIAAYIAQKDPRRAINFVAKIKQKISLLSEVPGLGRPRRDIAPNMRSIAVPPYVVFYRRSRVEVSIVRVVHGRRDLRNVFHRQALN